MSSRRTLPFRTLLMAAVAAAAAAPSMLPLLCLDRDAVLRGESAGDLVNGPPRIAGHWDDLNPTQGGTIQALVAGPNFEVIFTDVPEFFSFGQNTFKFTLRPDGTYQVAYGALSAPDGLAGHSQGGGVADPGETDLSEATSLPALGTTYELFGPDELDLEGGILVFQAP